jgi:hypothetical protein
MPNVYKTIDHPTTRSTNQEMNQHKNTETSALHGAVSFASISVAVFPYRYPSIGHRPGTCFDLWRWRKSRV